MVINNVFLSGGSIFFFFFLGEMYFQNPVWRGFLYSKTKWRRQIAIFQRVNSWWGSNAPTKKETGW